MSVNTNVISLNAQRNLGTSQSSLATSMQRLSSGLRVNSAKDDAAGLAISERMNAQVRGLNVAARNANDGISLAQTAEGALGKIGDMLQRVRELSVQSANATNSQGDRDALQAEVAQLTEEIGRVATQTEFNGLKLLNGSFSAQKFQVGANQGQTIDIAGIVNAQVGNLGSWTSVGTGATPVAGAAPAGSGAVAPTSATPTASAASGAFTDAAASGAGETFTLAVDGLQIFTKTSDGSAGAGDAVTAAELDSALGTFLSANTGYTAAGSFATDDLVLTKADGTDMAVSLTSTFATTAGSFAGTIVGTHTGGTPAGSGSAGTFSALGAGAFTINGTSIQVGTAADAATRANDLLAAINAQTATTGVSATVTSGALTLTGTGAINIGGTANVLEQTGLTAGNNAATPGTAMTGFASLDISSVAGANNAMLAMDAAINSVNSARGTLGAVQSRFENAIGNIQSTAENLTAARARIVDADFAMETANLSRSQILQQAGTAMVAQANQLPQQVLSLLR
jgi:flagellin